MSNFHFIKYSKLYFIFSGTLIILSLFFIIHYGLNFGIDLTGGSSLNITFQSQSPPVRELRSDLSQFVKGPIYITAVDKKTMSIKCRDDISQGTQNKIKTALEKKYKIVPNSTNFEWVGGIIGEETRTKSIKAILLSLIAIILYVAFAFRRVSHPVSSVKYGLATVIALLHDVTIPMGVFAILGKFFGIQVTVPIITALLTVFGYSVNDTVVVFDRIRENLIKRVGTTFEETVDRSLNQTLVRSINTSFTTLLVLFALFYLGDVTLKYFSLALILGISAGTYSSIFLASPLLVYWSRKKYSKK